MALAQVFLVATCSNMVYVIVMEDSNEKTFSILERAISPSSFLNLLSENSLTRASASLVGLQGGTRSPASPPPTSSGIPPTAVTTGGIPCAIASITDLGNPSLDFEAITVTSIS